MVSESKEHIEESVAFGDLNKLHKAIVKSAIKGIDSFGYATNVITKGERVSKDLMESETRLVIDIRYDDVINIPNPKREFTQDLLNLYAKAHFEDCDRELIKFIYGYIKQECRFGSVSFKKKDYARFTKGKNPSFESKSVVQFEVMGGAVNIWLDNKFAKYHYDKDAKTFTFEVVVDLDVNISNTMEEEMETQEQNQEIISEAVATKKPVKLPSTSKCAKEYITKLQKHGFVIESIGNQNGKLKTLKLDKDTSFFIVGGETYSGFVDSYDDALKAKKEEFLEKELPKLSKEVFGVDITKYIGNHEIERALYSVTRNIVMIGDVDMGKAVGIQLPNGLMLKVMIYITQGWGDLRFYFVCRLEGASTKKADTFETFPKFKIGTILRGTYGYNCTRNVFYKIVNRINDVVYLSQLKSDIVDGDMVEGTEVPSNREVGKFLKARIKDDRFEGAVYPTHLGFGLYLWDGKPCNFNSD